MLVKSCRSPVNSRSTSGRASGARQGGGLESSLHGTRADPDVLRNGGDGPALAAQGPDMVISCLPAYLALGRALVRDRGRA
jgi:hypothetical protein